MVILAFIFSSALTDIEGKIFLMNCPYPVFSALPTLTNITGVNVEYTIDYNTTAHANKVVIFECTIDPMTGLFGANTVIYEPTEGFFSLFDNAFAWIGYVYATITAFFQKVFIFFSLMWIIFNAPAEVTGFSFFTYINLLLSAFVAIGTFMIIRGS